MSPLLRFALRHVAPMIAIAATAHAASPLPKPDPDNGGLKLPAGFGAVVVADLPPAHGGPRHLAVAPNGDVYGKARNDGLYAMRDADGDGRAEVVEHFGRGRGTGVAVHNGFLYYSTDDAVHRYALAPGKLVPAGDPETIVQGLPNRRQHSAKAITFDGQGRLVVEVGSPSNALGNPDRGPGAVGSSPEQIAEFLKSHGGFWRFDANKRDQTQADGEHISTGHRHILAVAWSSVAQSLFVCQNGRDVLNVVNKETFDAKYNADRVSEEFHILREGANLGWPTTYYDPIDKVRLLSPEYGGDKRKRPPAGQFPDPLVAFPAHWAPMQMAYYAADQFGSPYRGGFFVSFHGSWNRAPEPQRGFNVCFVPCDERGMPRGTYEVFADGFTGTTKDFTDQDDAKYRPMGVAVGPDGSLYVGADQGSRVWRIFKTAP
jgi:glucose/arabinose dehydrogenase